jgi:acetyltransferase
MARVMPLDGQAVGATHPVGVRTLHDGRCIAVRSLDSTALEQFGAFVRGLSATSRALRFLAPIWGLSDDALSRLVLVDQRSNVAWIGEACTAPGMVVAEARYAVTAPAEAELAFAVADDWQRNGFGTNLLRRLLEHASAAGIERVWGYVRRDNSVALAVARRLGFEVRPDPDELLLFIVSRSAVGVAYSAADRGTPRRSRTSAFKLPWKIRSS